LPACKKDAARTTAAEPVESKPATPVGKPPIAIPRKVEVTSASLLRYLPRDSSMVFGVNWKKARQSEFVRSFDQSLVDVVQGIDGIQNCGLDPVTDIKSFAMSLGKDPKDDSGVVTAIHGNFDRQQVEDCIRQQGGIVEATRYDNTFHVFWPDPNTVVFSKGVSSELLSLAPSASAWDNDQLMMLVDEVDLHAEMWGAGMLPPDLASSFGSMGTPPFGLYFTVKVSIGMHAELGLEFRTLEEAEAMEKMVTMGLQMGKANADLQGIFSSVTSGLVGKAVVISAKFTDEQLKLLKASLQGLF
jgi:hypothetical protein